ncbi:UDP-glucose 4-epimerase GalE [Acinetobacter sp. A3.8]|uniref:UDP-glucose 4-epimerase n=1 Tax=Acinetobacter sedimenti TaxID=2919922 RepID=A0A9X1WUM0_9GAMM|nr:UDP-glucose 4-epimerase GalE [Acinetobacter sedimenti]MCJ8145544.1 UDP-glucose 4-epimerase GalE [Acinetobacter sedimenti]
MILLTGGLGYIGSHAATLLAKQGLDFIILDNLSNSKIDVLTRLEKITGKPIQFIHGDIRDRALLDQLFKNNPIQAVIHFAGLKAVGESMEKPLEYFDCNIHGSITLFEAMAEASIHKLVFSSSATVYGENDNPELVETMPTAMPTNNYGYTKLVIEQMLEKLAIANSRWSIAILRYFNPIGAHPSGLIGEDPQGIPNNLLPFVAKVATGELPILNVFGDDYPTPDGTAIRDYIHVMDLVDGHIKALDYIQNKSGCFIWNLGTGKGSSVLEIIENFEKVTGQKVPYQIAPRRAGDITACWANPEKSKHELDWQAHFSLEQMIEDLWRWTMPNKKEERI